MVVRLEAVKGGGRSLSEQSAEAIARAIENGDLAPGDRLPPERTLLEQLGVSRTVLREALKILEAHGLVEAQVGRGSFVLKRLGGIL